MALANSAAVGSATAPSTSTKVRWDSASRNAGMSTSSKRSTTSDRDDLLSQRHRHGRGSRGQNQRAALSSSFASRSTDLVFRNSSCKP